MNITTRIASTTGSTRRTRTVRIVGTAIATGALIGGLTACSGSTSSGDAASADYTFWDPYPQYDDTSDWAKTIDACATEAGVTVKRTAYDTSDLTNKALLAGQQDNSPDILLVDNPVVSTLADAGILTTTADNGLDIADIEANILAAGQIGDDTFGVPIGANTLALYYNPDVLAAAGVDISTVTDWASLTTALEQVAAAGKKGITFSGIGTEEGSFQFLPWFWGSGAELTELDSPEAVSAVTLWSDWVSKGYAPNSVINNTQTTSWEEFLTGDFAFAENGTWQKASAAEAGYEVIPLPASDGGSAPAPTGGEFFTVPVQSDTKRYEASAKIISCLTSTDNIVDTVNALNYIAPTKAAQEAQLAADPSLQPWIDAVSAAKGRTSDDLGTKYPRISEQLWTAVQNALTGSQSPEDALKAAQEAAAKATE
ncbi:extracellular solute-binding protein [Plantibacter sp. M259]|uniref:sugar ABC transporter substrate-binding protein n=1 Tax=Plantibacter sp. M259 TaxID=2583822 RepID=UPI00272D73C6|nr:extracellular solute-binding protein [Plantibacter sp. M259]